MKTRSGILPAALVAAAVLAVSTAASAMPTAVERGIVVQGGLQFQKSVVLNEAALCDGSVRLEKGTYQVRFDSLPGNKVHASFFQGGVKRGEASGIIIVGGATAKVHKPTVSFEDLGLHPASAHAFQKQGQKLDLVVGGQGSNQILIGLLLPAVHAPAIGNQKLDLQSHKVQPAGK